MIYYCMENIDDDFAFLPNSSNAEIDSFTAQECADDLFHNHDGWEYQWLVVIGLSESSNGLVEKWFKVELEMAPSFHAVPTEPEEVGE